MNIELQDKEEEEEVMDLLLLVGRSTPRKPQRRINSWATCYNQTVRCCQRKHVCAGLPSSWFLTNSALLSPGPLGVPGNCFQVKYCKGSQVLEQLYGVCRWHWRFVRLKLTLLSATERIAAGHPTTLPHIQICQGYDELNSSGHV